MLTDDEFNRILESKSWVMSVVVINPMTYKRAIYKLTHENRSYLLKVNLITSETDTDKYKIENEVTIQNDIYDSSQLCPAIRYHSFLSPYQIELLKNKGSLIEKLSSNFISQIGGGNSNPSEIVTAPYNPDEQNNQQNNGGIYLKYIHVICMDFLEGYYPMNSRELIQQLESKGINKEGINKDELTIQAIQIIIELLMKTGYSHGDFHQQNILFTLDDTTEFYRGVEEYIGIKIRPMLIDFEMSYKLDETLLNKIKGLYENEKYTDIIKLICGSEDAKVNLGRIHYQYICGIESSNILNRKIKKYIKMRNAQNRNRGYNRNRRSRSRNRSRNRGYKLNRRSRNGSRNRGYKRNRRSRNGSGNRRTVRNQNRGRSRSRSRNKSNAN